MMEHTIVEEEAPQMVHLKNPRERKDCVRIKSLKDMEVFLSSLRLEFVMAQHRDKACFAEIWVEQ